MVVTNRNGTCPCGSGKKYKKCCLGKETPIIKVASHHPALLQQGLNDHLAGHFVQAEAIYRQILQENPEHSDALHLLGLIAFQCGHYQSAVELIAKAIKITPNNAQYYSNLSAAHYTLGNYAEALSTSHHAILINPSFADAYVKQGNAYRETHQLSSAESSYRKAIALKTDFVEALNNLGIILALQGRHLEAIPYYRSILKLHPQHPETLYNLGMALGALGQHEEAISSYQQVIQLQPDHVEAHHHLGVLFYHLGRPEEAIIQYQQTLALKPNHADAYSNLGNAYNTLGNADQALISYRAAVTHNPQHAIAYSNLLLSMQYMTRFSAEEIFQEHLRFANQFESPLKAAWPQHLNIKDQHKRLKIGYVSADFRYHAVAFFIQPILSHHDSSQTEIYCYYNFSLHDHITAEISALADHWVQCHHFSDAQLAEKIAEDGIDILVDLSGHTAYNRLLTFARKPAPIQLTWLGYPGTTGLSAIDYRLTDHDLDPEGLTERFHSEKLLRLSSSANFKPEADSPPINSLPAMRSGRITLACLNNLVKINHDVIQLWAKILHALPDAQLLLGNVNDITTQQRVTQLFADAGVSAERLILKAKMPLNEYLLLHHEIDLALDPFPFNGGTTTYHSLWMGVPVITLAGNTTASRSGASILSRAGLTECITHSQQDYLDRVVAYANDLATLNRLRVNLRDRIHLASEDDSLNLTKELESTYRKIWQIWCQK